MLRGSLVISLCLSCSALRLTTAPAKYQPINAAAAAAARATPPPLALAAAAPTPSRTVVVTDMDETLISKKSTGYVIAFLRRLRAVRILLVPLLAAVLIPISKFDRTLAVRAMYWFAFRGVRVEKAVAIARDHLGPRYAADLQDPAASAVLAADDAIVITASPTFLARPWLERYLRVRPENIFGAELEERNGRFTGRTSRIPIGETKVEVLQSCSAAAGDAAETVGYGDHHSDLPFMKACSRGVLVLDKYVSPEELPEGVSYTPATKFTALERLGE